MLGKPAKGGGLVGPDGKPVEAKAGPAAPDAAQAQDQYLRSLAELENTRKRLQREKEEFLKYAAEGMVRQLLPIIDGLDQALVAVEKRSDPKALSQGVQLIHRQLMDLLRKEGVQRIPAVGEQFDPHQHEAVGQVPAADGRDGGTIAEEVHAGYTMHGKVLRPAMVKVTKATTDESTQEGQEDSGNG
jgi:molecular chaperone GrpE